MTIKETNIPGLLILEPAVFKDDRGALIRSFNTDLSRAQNLIASLDQVLISVNKKDVIRGMHFQLPPKEQVKIVSVLKGKIVDVILDLRKGSPSYGKHVEVELSDENNLQVYIPGGCAHGFVALEDDTKVLYLQDSVQSPAHEAGIHVNSFGMNWNIAEPIVSKKDQALQAFKDFDSPFIYKK